VSREFTDSTDNTDNRLYRQIVGGVGESVDRHVLKLGLTMQRKDQT